MTIHILGFVLTFFNLVFASMQKASKMQTHIILMCISIIFWLAGYYIELKATSLDMAMAGTLVTYLGKPFILMYFFYAICDFYGFIIKKSIYFLFYFLGAIEFVMVFTNSYTHLFYTSTSFDITNIYSPLTVVNGPLYYFHLLMMVFYFAICIIFIIKGYKKVKQRASAPYAIYFVLMVLSGLIGYIVYLSGITHGYDATMFGCLAGVFWLSILFYKYDLLDAIEIAKELALEKAPTGLVVLDHIGALAYANSEGKRLLGDKLKLDVFRDMTEKTKLFKVGELVYKLTQEKIFSEERHICTSYEISDVTDSVNYQNRLESEVAERTEKIKQIQRQIVGSMANVVEARSLETGEHIKRTSQFVEDIAIALKDKWDQNPEGRDKLDNREIALMVSAAPLHDVGKISVPDAVLLKPGKLTPEEFEQIKKHPVRGAEIVEEVMRGVETDEYVDLAKDIAKYHHERWDGTGYPEGLKEKQIPLAARIMAVADVYDALTAERCYKKAMPKEKAIEIIQEESGTHFDPEVVDAFLSVYNLEHT